MTKTTRDLLLCKLGYDMSTMTATQLAKLIDRSPATVSSMLKKMHDAGLLDIAIGVGPRGGMGYKLTAFGRLAYVGVRFKEGFVNLAIGIGLDVERWRKKP